MLSKKLFINSLKTAKARFSPSINMLTFTRATQFSGCGTGGCGSGGGCGSKKKELTKFSPEMQHDIMGPMPTILSQPSLRPTKIREAYSEEFNRTGTCNGSSKLNDWSRDVPLMTIQEAIREASRCLKCNDAPC